MKNYGSILIGGNYATSGRQSSLFEVNDTQIEYEFSLLEHVWDQLFTVDTIWNIGETGDIDGGQKAVFLRKTANIKKIKKSTSFIPTKSVIQAWTFNLCKLNICKLLKKLKSFYNLNQ